MIIVEVDAVEYNKMKFDRREFLGTKTRMKEWFRYMNYPRGTKVYKYTRPNGIKWFVEE